jgi:hypothetical protein
LAIRISPPFEIAFVLVRLSHVTSFIVNTNHGIMSELLLILRGEHQNEPDELHHRAHQMDEDPGEEWPKRVQHREIVKLQ